MLIPAIVSHMTTTAPCEVSYSTQLVAALNVHIKLPAVISNILLFLCLKFVCKGPD